MLFDEKSELKFGLSVGILHLVFSCRAAIWLRHKASIFGDHATGHAAVLKTSYPPDVNEPKVSAISPHTLHGKGILAIERKPGRKVLKPLGELSNRFRH